MCFDQSFDILEEYVLEDNDGTRKKLLSDITRRNIIKHRNRKGYRSRIAKKKASIVN